MDLTIRVEREEDYSRITEVNDLAFEGPGEGQLIEKLRGAPNFLPELSLVAEVGGVLVGHILFSVAAIVTASDRVPALALAPMSVLSAWQKKGIGSRLVRDGLARAKALGHQSVIVLGHADYYPKFGFQPASRWGIRSTYDVPDEVFMALELQPGALKEKNGMMEYPKEFLGV